jgi:hypothetical protein
MEISFLSRKERIRIRSGTGGAGSARAIDDRIMRGHYAYYGISGNSRRIRWFACQIVVLWKKWLARRHRGGGAFPWTRLNAILKRHPLPPARIVYRLYANASDSLIRQADQMFG